jgi:hypothetical protein
MSALRTRTYRVFYHTWDVYDATVEAGSCKEALAKAEALYNAEGLEAYRHFSAGDDGFNVEEDE